MSTPRSPINRYMAAAALGGTAAGLTGQGFVETLVLGVVFGIFNLATSKTTVQSASVDLGGSIVGWLIGRGINKRLDRGK